MSFKSINISWIAAGLVVLPEGGDVTKVNFEIGVSGRVLRKMASGLNLHPIVCLPVSVTNGKRPFPSHATPRRFPARGTRRDEYTSERMLITFRYRPSTVGNNTIEYCVSINYTIEILNIRRVILQNIKYNSSWHLQNIKYNLR